MQNPTLNKYAKLIVNYCLPVKSKNYIVISASFEALPLVKEVYRELLIRNAIPEARFHNQELREIFLKEGAKWQLEFVSPFEKYYARNIDGLIYLDAPLNLKSLSNVDPKRMSLATMSRKPVRNIYLNREEKNQFYWLLAEYPTNAAAQEASMSLQEYEDFVLRACFLHKANPVIEWKKFARKQNNSIKKLKGVKSIRILGQDTDLRLSTNTRNWISCDGVIGNMPDGEILTSPVENSAEGTIRFSFPAIYMNREVEDVFLRFRKGKVIEARAQRGQNFLRKMLATDAGASRLGEFAIGTNPYIRKFIKNMLFDEKMTGTIHLALGSSIPHTGGKNRSAIHWDFLKDMKRNSKIYADDKLIYKDGSLLI